MPAGTGAGGSGNTAERTVFRPPWVKEGPTPKTTPTAPWTLKHRESKGQEDAPPAPKLKPKPIETKPSVDEENPPSKFPVQLRKTSGPQPKENGRTSPSFKPIKDQVTLRPTPKDPVKIVPIKREDSNAFERPKLVSQRTLRDSNDTSKPPLLRRERPKPRNAFDDDIPSAHILRKQDSILNIIPPAPPVPPAPPCPPPPPKIVPDGYTPPTDKKMKFLEQLRQRPRVRPDWGTLLKDVEAGRKLKHVVCNDRSKPLLPLAKCKTKEGQFVYDSEKKESNAHNILLKQIQSGVQLKKVQTNDRSKPILDGLRKFRRQMTIEEQIQKSQSSAKLGVAPDEEKLIILGDEADEMDDIDKLRDDLQSTKQLLALELRNKEAQQKEIKRLQARILNLEVELEHEKGKAAASVTRSVMAERIEDDKLVASLKQEAEDARKAAKEAEKKYIKATDTLDTTKGELDEAKRQNEILERKLEQAMKLLSGGGSRRQSQAVGKEEGEASEEEEECSDSDSDDDEEGEETEEKKEKRAKRELKMLMNKLKNAKTKKENARKERQSLKQQMKKEQDNIKEEKKKYKHLQREVDKMAELMKEDDDENADEDGEEKEIDEDEIEDASIEEEEEESETETESSSESEEEESESEPEDAPFDKRKENYTSRVRRYENCLAALKKGNYLLKANIDRLKDDINKQREMSLQLQQDLDSVLNDLG